jgi:hypothetical protein
MAGAGGAPQTTTTTPSRATIATKTSSISTSKGRDDACWGYLPYFTIALIGYV